MPFLFSKSVWFTLPVRAVILLLAVLTTCVYNFSFLKEIYESDVSTWHFIQTILLTTLSFAAIFCFVLWPKITKPFICLWVITNTIASYFVWFYNVPLDKIMMINVLETDRDETWELVGLEMIAYFFCWAVLPIILILKTRILYFPWRKALKIRFLFVSIVLAFLAVSMLPYRKELKDYLRENFAVRYVLMPTSYISSLIGAIHILYIDDIPVVKVNQNPIVQRYWEKSGKKNLFVFVMGETARDASFSLTGYTRKTNAPLEPFAKDMFVFSKTHSCATTTRLSVPCIFLHYTRETLKPRAVSYTKSVLDVLHENGYQVTWLENDSACKGLCRHIDVKVTCSDRNCYDENLVRSFVQMLPNIKEDSLFVLHQHGSHGPAYANRYPPEMEIWSPVCRDPDLKDCSLEELRNVYDNTIYYTSHVLASLMTELEKMTDRFNPVLIYTSDHGESLGENGRYLHGGPWDEAPAVEKEVPFFVWMPASSRQALGLDVACFQQRLKVRQSHDNIFHSLLGLSGITIDLYDPRLDLFNGCLGQEF